jgi:hypothetical protein
MSSAYIPPSAAKLISSKKIPYIVGWILMLVGVPSRSKVNFEFCADENATQLERKKVKILFLVFIDTILIVQINTSITVSGASIIVNF